MTGRERFQGQFNVSRETLEQLDAYAEALAKWNPRINLVAKSTLPDLWTRHFADTAVLHALAPPEGHWLDMGSGGGFPGLVIAAMRPDQPMTLLESDQRKCAFLRQTARAMDLSVTVLTDRIEGAPPQAADILSARALAPLDMLLTFAERHGHAGTHSLFLKGERVEEELTTARQCWTFTHTTHPSGSGSAGVVLALRDIARV